MCLIPANGEHTTSNLSEKYVGCNKFINNIMHKLAPKFHSVAVVATLVYITAQ